ncbi:hypothetical protein ACP275_10G038500 [Erythranthe tilingii]
MEVYAPCNSSACLEISSNRGSSIGPHNLIPEDKGLSMIDLKTSLNEVLNIKDIKKSTSGFNISSEEIEIGNAVKEHESAELDKSASANSAQEKHFSKCATFPVRGGSKSSGDAFVGEKGKQSNDLIAEVSEVNSPAKPCNGCHSRSMSLPILSAMKGSREKQGTTPTKKLSVTWAPDVYDPVPTSVSHFPSNKNQRRKSGKYKQKGKSSRGSSKGKDKKQGRKNGGSSSSTNKLKPFHEESGVSFVETQAVDFHVGNPDQFCGNSFMKNSMAELRYPVAEAT